MKKKKAQFVKEQCVNYKTNTITIPVEVFETADTKEEIEDWLLAHDPEFIKRMRKAKADMEAGKFIPWEQVKQKLSIK
ncbi:MAG: hypothetical protein AB1349_04670 [Elusimicrobiota bacterium]